MNHDRLALLLLLSAPSGAGKTTLCQNLVAKVPGIQRVVTCTTRAPRPGEIDGRDYHFLSREEFGRRIAAGDFLEHAQVYGQGYGTLRGEVLDRLRSGQDVLLNIDVQGAAAVRSAAAQDAELQRSLVTVFLAPPSRAELERRLRGRGTEDANELRTRLDTARQELAHWRQFDYLLVSGTPEEDLARLAAILAVEHLRSHRTRLPSD